MADTEHLDLERFNEIISAYSSTYSNSPRSTAQLVEFCKTKQYRFKYGQLRPFYSVWRTRRDEAKAATKKAQTPRISTAGSNKTPKADATNPGDSENDASDAEDEEQEIDWNAFWAEYRAKHGYPPKKALHLWNFAKEDKHMAVPYKEARQAFDRMVVENTPSSADAAAAIEGRTRSASEAATATAKSEQVLNLRVTRRTSAERLREIRAKFLELLSAFRAQIRHDPASAHQLFTFVAEHTPYKARYADLKKCLTYGAAHEWFTPMKRRALRKAKSTARAATAEGSEAELSDGDDEGVEVEFVLEVDHERIAAQKASEREEKAQAEMQLVEVLSDDEFEAVLAMYAKEFENPPRNAAQVRNFANVDFERRGQRLKYKAVRMAFERWHKRGAVMPERAVENEGC